MPAPNFDVSRLGQQNLAGSTDELFLKIFGQMVLNSFNQNNVFKDMTMQRVITSGKSAQFPAIGKTTAGYHVPGTMIVGDEIPHSERTINVDDILFSSVSIAEIDELKNHYDVRAEYAKQLGEALAENYDRKQAQLIALAARASATVTGGDGGTVLNGGATAATDASVLAGLIFESVQALAEKNVIRSTGVQSDCYVSVRPQQYYLLAQNTDIINKDWGGAGAYSDGTVFRIAGLPVVMSNSVPNANIAANTGENNTYNGDFSDTVALVHHKSAVGTVKLRDVKMSMTGNDHKVTHSATLMKADVVCGSGILRPESAIEITSAV